ncbi:hypothetical protein NQ317_018463 [Molorchus minor]|uniref:Uncharacterized protein n=1 Tax=Molorchus minor TaxID=1323400 RepID=A0ABQ9JF51_9CUCU|nr:hypothetical protein NQ317_018463 [Molorchus minor]
MYKNPGQYAHQYGTRYRVHSVVIPRAKETIVTIMSHLSYGGVQAVHEQEHAYHSYPPKYQGHHEESYSSKEHDLADLFDVALTALAFLSFGMFIVHIIMCISAAHKSTTTSANMMMPMSMGPTSTGMMGTNTGDGGGSMTATGGGGTGTGTGGGATATGGGTSTGGGETGAGDGANTAGGEDAATGSDMTATAEGSTGGGGDGGTAETGGGTADEGTGGGGEPVGGDSTGGTSPGDGSDENDSADSGENGDGNGDGDGDGDSDEDDENGTAAGKDTFKFRWKRDIPTITNPNHHVLNELARRVLVSIEAALISNNDDGVCLRKSLCENNKFSRSLEGKDKLIIPMWSRLKFQNLGGKFILGMSWLSGRLIKNILPATSMLDTLKASILGLGKANCEIIYQECDLRREVKESRRRRRRRRRRRAL